MTNERWRQSFQKTNFLSQIDTAGRVVKQLFFLQVLTKPIIRKFPDQVRVKVMKWKRVLNYQSTLIGSVASLWTLMSVCGFFFSCLENCSIFGWKRPARRPYCLEWPDLFNSYASYMQEPIWKPPPPLLAFYRFL